VALLVALAVVAVGGLLYTLRSSTLAGGGATGEKVTYQRHNLPPLAMGGGSQTDEAVSRGGRNPFTYGAPPTPTAGPRPPTPTPAPTVIRTPPATPTPRLARGADGEMKPPPPPFDREFIGHFGPLSLQVAAFRPRGGGAGSGEVEVAVVGEVLDGVYIVREIGLESVVIGYVGYDRSEDTRVPLAEK
jgi:hypothetical protein